MRRVPEMQASCDRLPDPGSGAGGQLEKAAAPDAMAGARGQIVDRFPAQFTRIAAGPVLD